MTGWAIIPDSDVDAESPITESLMFRLRDNPKAVAEGDVSVPAADLVTLENQRTDSTTTTDVYQPDGSNGISVGPLSIGAIVGQGELKTAQGTVVATTFGAVLPGGEYGLYVQLKDNGSHSGYATVGGTTMTTGFVTYIARNTASSGVVTAQQRYITASPPYDLGGGLVPLFVFILMSSSGKIKSVYVAQDPPWAYNGPTDIRGEKRKQLIIDPETEKETRQFVRMRKTIEKQFTMEHVKSKQISMKEYISQEVIETWIPIDDSDQAFKNSDMGLIPHPFGLVESGDTVVLLDPTNTEGLLQSHHNGDDISDIIMEGYLKVDNASIPALTPEGVAAHSFKWKDTI